MKKFANMTSSGLVMRIMALSLNASKRAGEIIKEVMQRGELNIVEKCGKDDLQTEADRSAQAAIIASLHSMFQKVTIIGEEGVSNLDVKSDWVVKELDEVFLEKPCPPEWRDIKEEDLVIWVDPLDGTSEYTQGFLDHVTVLIGISTGGAAIGGVIHQPYYKNVNGELGRTIYGLKGLGTGGFELVRAPENRFIVTTTRSHLSPVVQAALDALQPDEVIKVGGAGYKVLQLLEGKAHAYVFASSGCKKWDTCAPEAVLEASGGILTDIAGNHYHYDANVEYVNREGVLASIGSVCHSEIAKKIPKTVLDALHAK